jgi:hypothetical protein
MSGQYGQTVHAQVLPPHGVTDAELERRLAVAQEAGLERTATALRRELKYRGQHDDQGR